MVNVCCAPGYANKSIQDTNVSYQNVFLYNTIIDSLEIPRDEIACSKN